MAQNLPPLINGASYSWSDIVCNVLGTPLAGINSIEYDDSVNIGNLWGAGQNPVSRAYEKYEAKGSITIMQEEMEPFLNAIGTRRLQDIPEFDVIISFISLTQPIVTHKLRNCRFKNNGITTKSNQLGNEIKLELVMSHIEW